MHVRFIRVPPTKITFQSGRSATVVHGDIYNVSAIKGNDDGTVDITFDGFPHHGEIAAGISTELLEMSEPVTRLHVEGAGTPVSDSIMCSGVYPTGGSG